MLLLQMCFGLTEQRHGLTNEPIRIIIRIGSLEIALMSYKGKITTAGTSNAIRLEKDLFKQNPEFKQQAEVRADIIGPGKMLISVVDNPNTDNEDDPIVGAFLAFIEKDMLQRPAAITSLDANIIARAKALTAGVTVNDDDFDIDDEIKDIGSDSDIGNE